MKIGQLLGTWFSLGLVTVLPMCESDDVTEQLPTDGGDTGAGGQSSAGSHARAAQGGADAAESAGSSSHAAGAGTHHSGIGGVGGRADEPGLAGAGGLWGYTGPHLCTGEDDGISCCKSTDRSCDEVPGDWCTIGGQGPTAEGESCCDNGQRKVCGVAVQGETGLEIGWGLQACECAAKKCECAP